MIEEYLTYMGDVKGKSENTIDGYRNDLNIFYEFLKSRFKCKEISDKIVNKVTLTDLHAYVTYLTKTRKNGNKAKARKIACLKSYYNYLKLMGIVKENPSVDLETPKIEYRLPKHLTLEQANSLLDVIDGRYKERDYCIIMLFLNCGMRLTELVNIDLDDVRNDTLRVIGKGNKERTIYLNEVSLKAISDYLKVRPDVHERALFINSRKTRLEKKGVQHVVDKYLEQANLKGYSVHKLRHTAATLMYQYGNVDIRALQEILGHESVATTQIYTHIQDEQLKNAVNNNPLNRKGEKNNGC